MQQKPPVEKKPGKTERKPAIPTQNIKKTQPPPTQTDKKVKQPTPSVPEQEPEQREQQQVQVQQIPPQPELEQVEPPLLEAQFSQSSQDQPQPLTIETQNSRVPELEAIVAQQSGEINQLQSSLGLVKEDLENIKKSSALLQQLNKDYQSQISTLKKRAEQLEKEQGAQNNNDDLDELTELVETLTMERDNYQHKFENLKKQYDECTDQLKNLQYEKEIAELTLQEAILSGGSNLEPEEGNQNKELVNMNNQLRQALNAVKNKLDESELMYQAEQLELLQELESCKAQAEKAKQVDKLQKQLEVKDKIIEELSQRVDDLQALTEMTEQLTDSMIRKDDEIAVLKSNKKELIELRKYDEEYLNELEEILKKRTEEIKAFESDLLEKNRTLQIQKQEIEEKDSLNNRLKQKIGQLSKELDLVREDQTPSEQIQELDKNNQVSKAQELLLKCQEVQGQRRDMQKKYFDLLVQNSSIRNDVLLKSVILMNSMPQDYSQRLKFSVIDYIIVVRKVGDLSYFLAEEFIQTLDNNAETYIKEENSDFGFWIIDVLKSLYELYNLSQTVSLAFENATKTEYVERSSKNNVLINQFKMAGQAVDQILTLLKEDSLTSRESISGLKMIISHIREDVVSLLEQFTEFTNSVEYKGIILRQKLCKVLTTLLYWYFNGKVIRDIEIQKSSKKGPFILDQLIDTLYQRTKIQLKVLCNYRQSWGTFEIFLDKFAANYDNLDKFLGETNQFIEERLNTDTHELYLTGKGDEQSLKDESYNKFRDSIISLVHNLTILNKNLGEKNSSLEDVLESFNSGNKNNKQSIHIYNKNSVWANFSSSLLKQLHDNAVTLESEKKLQQELEKMKNERALLSNDLSILKKTREALEGRIVELQLKADRVQVVETEKKQLQNKIERYQQGSESAKLEYQNLENRSKEIEDERNNLEQLIVIFSQAFKTNKNSIAEAAEPIISRSSTKLQARLIKIIDSLKQEIQPELIESSRNLEVSSKVATAGEAINKILWKNYQGIRSQELRGAILSFSAPEDERRAKQLKAKRCQVMKLKIAQMKQQVQAQVINLKDPESIKKQTLKSTLNSYKFTLGEQRYKQNSFQNSSGIQTSLDALVQGLSQIIL